MILHLQGGEKINISDEDGNKVKEVLMSQSQPLFIEIGGETIKTSTIKAVLKEGQSFLLAKDEFHWSDEDLSKWEEEMFNEESPYQDFNAYLISEGVIGIMGKVKDTEKYRTLQAKWGKLQELRFTREKAKGFPGAEERKKQTKIKLANLIKSMSVEPLDEIKNPEPIIKKDDIYEEKKRINLKSIPF